MIVTNTKREKNTVTFEVTLEKAEFEKYVNDAYKKAKKNIMVPGFRKGKAPRTVIEGMYGKDIFYDDALSDAAPAAFTFGAEESKLEVVGTPGVEKYEFNEEGALVLFFKADVWPEVELGEYKGLEAPKDKVEVSDEEVDGEIADLRKQQSRISPVERAAENGDTLNIDFEGFVDGEAFSGGKGENYDLELGSGSFIPGFEEQLIGMNAGEEKDINVHFPENYKADLADKDAVFHIKCNGVKETILPELDDEFAKDCSEFDTLDELKESIRARLLKTREDVAYSAFEELIVAKAAENMTVDIPESMMEERLDSKVNEYARYMAAQGLPIEEYLKMTGMTPESFRENYRSSVETEVRNEILLRAVAEAENLEATEEEMEEEYQTLANQYGMKLESVKAAIDPEDMKSQMLQKKAAAFIADNGIPTDPVEEEEVSEEAAEEEAE